MRLLSFFISQLFDQKIVLLSEAMKFNLSVVNKERLGKDNGDSNGDEVVKNAVGLVSKQQPYTPNYVVKWAHVIFSWKRERQTDRCLI